MENQTHFTIAKNPRSKNKKWCCRWTEFDTGDEKRRSKAFQYRQDAENYLAKLRTGTEPKQNAQGTLQQFCDDWFSIAKPNLRTETRKLYDNTIRRLLDAFGDTVLQQITPQTAARFIAELQPLNSKKPLSNWSRFRTLRNCRTMFAAAVEWNLLSVNPFKAVKRPKCVGQQWHYLTVQQYNALLDTVSLRWRGFYALAYTAGLRLGEILNLTWSDVDLDSGEVIVRNRPATETLPGFNVKDADSRTIPIPQHTVRILAELFEQRPAGVPFCVLSGSEYHTLRDKWIRYTKSGRAWTNRDAQNNTLKTFKRHVKQAGIVPVGTLAIHTLRKSCITNWTNTCTNPETVRKLAGHGDIATTMKFYVQVTKEQKHEVAEGIDRLLGIDG